MCGALLAPLCLSPTPTTRNPFSPTHLDPTPLAPIPLSMHTGLCSPCAPLGPPSFNQLGEGGASALAKALELNTSLTDLHLGYAHGGGLRCSEGQRQAYACFAVVT
jgi:hypothetical protein